MKALEFWAHFVQIWMCYLISDHYIFYPLFILVLCRSRKKWVPRRSENVTSCFFNLHHPARLLLPHVHTATRFSISNFDESAWACLGHKFWKQDFNGYQDLLERLLYKGIMPLIQYLWPACEINLQLEAMCSELHIAGQHILQCDGRNYTTWVLFSPTGHTSTWQYFIH